jgi:RNA polymerase sigma-70 factor, ECF subfamily
MSMDHVLIQAAIDSALERWPDLMHDVGCFTRHAEQLGMDAHRLQAYGPELYLTYSCAAGDSRAIRILDQQYLPGVIPALRRLGAGDVFVQETRVDLLHRLLAPPEPKITSYSGTGSLGAWLRVAAVRVGLNRLRSAPNTSVHVLAEHLVEDACPELSELPRCREALRQAVHAAFEGFSTRDRTLLRLHYADGVTLDQLARHYQVHRASVARWLAELKRGVMCKVEAEVRVQLQMTQSEFRSVVRALRSSLDFSFSELLGAGQPVP